jgi:hypothetical protein
VSLFLNKALAGVAHSLIERVCQIEKLLTQLAVTSATPLPRIPINRMQLLEI